eukprot:Filipodium_phascolosomae@DN4504_c0_g1_i1.p1
MKTDDLPPPDQWTETANPPYSYWIDYRYANIRSLKIFRKNRGLNTLSFRPHFGEAGSVPHLATCFLLADSISHGLQLKSSPPLHYLYYLRQIGIHMSPLSNNLLYCELNKHPFPSFFFQGLSVSLSTDDPLMFHFTDEPLLEEYSTAAHTWKLTSVDMCELARNSVLHSDFEKPLKCHWLGSGYSESGPQGNDIRLSNVPNIRIMYRYDTLQSERESLKRLGGESVESVGSASP